MTITLRSLGLGARTCRQLLNTQQPRVAVTAVRSYADAPVQRRRVPEYEYEEEPDEDRPWEFSDISSLAHGELEQHREARHYARIAAYEMPRLFQLAKDFELPKQADVLRFRYTTYLGEKHPAESKVVVEFAPSQLPLTVPEQKKLIKLAGPRYNPQKRIVKMSCESFEYQAQNKRYLVDMVHKLMAEARNHEDMFEDIPFDFRHHTPKPKNPKIPHEWLEMAKNKKRERKGLPPRPAKIPAPKDKRVLGTVAEGAEGAEKPAEASA